MLSFILGAEEPNSWLLPGDINEVYWGSLAFFIILAVFLWKGLGPLQRIMAQRSERIAGEIDAATTAREQAEDELAATKQSLANADEEAARIVADGRTRAATLKADLVARAEADVEAARARARAEIDAHKGQTLSDLRAEVATRTMVAAEAVVHHALDDATQSELIDRYIDQVGGVR